MIGTHQVLPMCSPQLMGRGLHRAWGTDAMVVQRSRSRHIAIGG